MNTTKVGQEAETIVAKYLRALGYKVVDQNWRSKYCEIDVIAKKDKRIYFVEVKYRKHKLQGTGLDYVTNQKIKRMKFAAEFWTSEYSWSGDYSLAAAEVTGPDFEITGFVWDID